MITFLFASWSFVHNLCINQFISCLISIGCLPFSYCFVAAFIIYFDTNSAWNVCWQLFSNFVLALTFLMMCWWTDIVFSNWDIADLQYYIQVCNTVAQNFYGLYSIYSYYKILFMFLCYMIFPCSFWFCKQ